MKNTFKFMSLLIVAFFTVMGCDNNPTDTVYEWNGEQLDRPGYRKELVVNGFLWGNKYLTADHAILISVSQPVDESYSFDDAAVKGANVTLTDLSNNEVTILSESPDRPGFYFNSDLLIKPKTNYKLRVEAEDTVVTASTTVPPELKMTTNLKLNEVNNVFHTNLGYSYPVMLETENLDQIIYVDMFCNETYDKAEYIYPFNNDHKFPSDQDEYDGNRNGEPRHIYALVPYKDLLSDLFPGHTVYWYASMIVFYGSNTMQIMAIDDNYHNFLYKEHPEINGGVVGGIGVFGSVCGEEFHLMVQKETN